MKKHLDKGLVGEPLDPFALAPALSLVPASLGKVSRLSGLRPSLHARREKTSSLRQELERQQGQRDKDAYRRVCAEDAMLEAVLQWLQTHAPGEE